MTTLTLDQVRRWSAERLRAGAESYVGTACDPELCPLAQCVRALLTPLAVSVEPEGITIWTSDRAAQQVWTDFSVAAVIAAVDARSEEPVHKDVSAQEFDAIVTAATAAPPSAAPDSPLAALVTGDT